MTKINNLTHGQRWFSVRMQSLDYPSERGGTCYGSGNLIAIEGILPEDFDENGNFINYIDHFDQIFKLAHDISPKELPKIVKTARQEYIKLVRNAKAEAWKEMQEILARENKLKQDDKLPERALTKIQMEQFLKLFRNKKKDMVNNPAFKGMHNILDIPALFELIEIYHQAYLHAGYFPEGKSPKNQNALAAAQLVLSQSLKKLGGVAKLTPISGIYTLDELTVYFRSLRQSLIHHQPPFTHPISLFLNNSLHGITVGYNPHQKTWIFFNSSQLPTQYVPVPLDEEQTIAADKEIAAKVFEAFTFREIHADQSPIPKQPIIEDKEVIKHSSFSTHIYVAKNYEIELNNCLAVWQSRPEWIDMHEVTSDKANLIDSTDGSWLYIAALENNLKKVTELLTMGAKPNQAIKFGNTPLYIAAQMGHYEIVNELLRWNADPNLVVCGCTPLHVAVLQGHLEIVEELLKNKADPSPISYIDPVALAKQRGHLAIVHLLEQALEFQKLHREIAKLKDQPAIPERTLAIQKLRQYTTTSLAEFKKVYADFKRFDDFALDLFNIFATHQAVGKKEFKNFNSLKEKIKRAYQDYDTDKDITASIPALQVEANEIGDVAEATFNKTSSLSFAGSYIGAFFNHKASLAVVIHTAVEKLGEIKICCK